MVVPIIAEPGYAGRYEAALQAINEEAA